MLLAACRAPDVGPDPADTLTSWNGMDMVRIRAGTFTMGGGPGDATDYYADSEVTLTRDFWIARTEVTVAEWLEDTTDSADWDRDAVGCPDDACALDTVTWMEGARFLNWMSEGEGLPACHESDGSAIASPYLTDPYSCPGYRFPTHAEWEYAAKAGEDTRWAGSDDNLLVAWTDENATSNQPGCLLEPNAYGLCDMSGNVLEWVSDWAESGRDDDADPEVDPVGPASSSQDMRGNRGGAWWVDAGYATVTMRSRSHAEQ